MVGLVTDGKGVSGRLQHTRKSGRTSLTVVCERLLGNFLQYQGQAHPIYSADQQPLFAGGPPPGSFDKPLELLLSSSPLHHPTTKFPIVFHSASDHNPGRQRFFKSSLFLFAVYWTAYCLPDTDKSHGPAFPQALVCSLGFSSLVNRQQTLAPATRAFRCSQT